ncbi:glycoside hydrolase superfamily [Fomitopsis serialis]|uniref:glycoside hydrolase superfamily n=1 Tax=Fomitopsis serialis TaxID=139415 RepID=UPI00200871F0|nr:glycoside hydrolase superfamily [Neoantrodia serialis]KAH9920968.1 glycoside hydrolase superfamily [Neoantrodia serialis]
MMFRSLIVGLALVLPIASQQIQDIWTTTSDKNSLFKYQNLGSDAIQFTNDASASANIKVEPNTTYQEMIGFGAALTDSTAQLLSQLKSSDSGKYWALLNYIFNSTDGAQSAGMTYLRIPIGSSDFSQTSYTYDDVDGDSQLDHFDIDNAPAYLFDTLKDIQSINSVLKVHLCPWSAPAWMKESKTITGGKFASSYTKVYAQYLLKSLQAFQKMGVTAHAISLQNEPQNSNPTYASALVDPSLEAKIGSELRPLMDSAGFKDTVIVAYEHNWDDAGAYPVTVMDQAADSFAGAAFHCYGGDVGNQEQFHDKYPQKDIYFTECTGSFNGDFWSDLQWYMNNIFIGSVNHHAKNAAMWNLVLDDKGEPLLNTTTSCRGSDPCRGVVTLKSDGSYVPNQEFYAIAQASKAVIPKDQNGPFGQRISSSVSGSDDLVVTAYVTKRAADAPSTAWPRYSLVVLNQRVSGATGWMIHETDRVPQAEYKFPTGVTTLWWYAQSD